MTDAPDDRTVPLSHLPAPEKSKRSSSFGAVAAQYGRYRPGPPPAAADWLLPRRVARVVDLGAGTGALSRLLVERADEVVAVEPDQRMRAVLAAEVPGVRAVAGRGEAMPLPDGWADAVLASSSWHWMDPGPACAEVARVLVPGGFLGTIWSGPDPEGAFLLQASELLAARPGGTDGDPGDDGAVGREMAELIMGDADRPSSRLEIPPDAPFDDPEHEVFHWDMALTADDLIGLLGTFSWFITMEAATRERTLVEARRLLQELLGVEGPVTVDIGFRAEAWRARCRSGAQTFGL